MFKNNKLIISICFLMILGNSLIYTQEQKTTNEIDMILDSVKDKRKRDIFPIFHSLHKKTYHPKSPEGAKRYKIFKANMKWIKQKNAELGAEVYGITPFTDITKEEFKNHYLMSPEHMQKTLGDLGAGEMGRFPKSENSIETGFNMGDAISGQGEKFGASASNIDWRNLFVNNPAKDQKTCGACWSFSANAAIEANYKLKFGEDKKLSVQYLLDCDLNDNGCAG